MDVHLIWLSFLNLLTQNLKILNNPEHYVKRQNSYQISKQYFRLTRNCFDFTQKQNEIIGSRQKYKMVTVLASTAVGKKLYNEHTLTQCCNNHNRNSLMMSTGQYVKNALQHTFRANVELTSVPVETV
jgi:hypothetical protein